MKRLYARAGILVALLGATGAMTLTKADAITQCSTGPLDPSPEHGCVWSDDANDRDSEDGSYVATQPTGGATWSCIIDGDVQDDCTLIVDGVDNMTCQMGTPSNPEPGRWEEHLQMEGSGDICQWDQTPGQPVSFHAVGSTSGAMGDTPGRTP